MSRRDQKFPALHPAYLQETRDAVHAYARVIGAWAAAGRMKRKHWWHASLRPSLYGLTTGVIYGDVDYQLELNLASSLLHIRTCTTEVTERLTGQPSREIAAIIRNALLPLGVDESAVPGDDKGSIEEHAGYDAEQASLMHRALGSVAGALEDFRAGVREEKSPIQLWPHHFDLSMIWLPGHKVSGEDITDEELADKQMNFGFAFGDSSISEPYFYVTAYPLPPAMPSTRLPAKTEWRSDGFNGAVTLYRDVAAMVDPAGYLLDVWRSLHAAGQQHLAVDE